MKKINLAILILIFSVANTTQVVAQNKSLDNEVGIIPEKFGKEKSTLLVVKTPADFQANKLLEKNFEKYYTGPIEIIKYMDQFESIYHDSLRYRYKVNLMINMKTGQFTTRRPQGGFDREPPANEYSFSITDQKTKKSFDMSFYTESLKKLVEAYVKKLEGERKKYE